MTLDQLLRALAENSWHRGAGDVEVSIDNGNGAAFTLEEVCDHGNHITLIGDRIDPVTDEMVEAFGRAWAETPEGRPGDRRRAGLSAAFEVVR